ncbi:T9SS type A sorting domain-containing protein [candidate division TA06 bacterium]|uniref:T9SS type A sorting domain-containing protein n=1 Tax=candidate division TA06 bacterium TaxID=2250710 RepID=A0A933MJ50_UNCT6|nr:T9SS type A sorting domain-containing protein [candidate division TA06 bacterium]
MVSSDWTVPYDWDYTAYLYYKDATGQPYSGFAVLCGDTAFKPSLGIIDSLKRPVTDSSVDTLNWANITVPNMGWAKLNGNYEIRWHVMETYPSDTLWPEVWDITYGVVVPYDSTILNNVTTPSWNIGGAASVLGRRYVTSTWPTSALSFMNLCGYRVYFNRNATTRLMTWATHPQEGDIWRIYSSGPIPPREGDVYSFTPTGVEGVPSGIDATSLLLRQNAPNPFKQLTTINYQLAKPGLVNLKVYNIAGQLVRTLDEGYRIPGAHSIKWDGRDSQGNKVSSGIYIYRLQAENKDMTRKLVVLR